MTINTLNIIKALNPRFWVGDVSFSLWEYGTCNGMYARRHKVNKNVQFIIFKKGDQKYVDGIGHTEDKWVNFDSSWWDGFTPTN
jgi:hypothetical protein